MAIYQTNVRRTRKYQKVRAREIADSRQQTSPLHGFNTKRWH